MGQMGMWDGPNIEGPSCIRLPPLELCTLEDLEATYVQGKNTYFSGQPVVDDAMFDKIEKRLVSARRGPIHTVQARSIFARKKQKYYY